MDGHAQIKKCPNTPGVFSCFSRLTGMAPAQDMTRNLLDGSRKRRPLAALGFSPGWGLAVSNIIFPKKILPFWGVSTHLRLSRGLGTSLQPRVGTPPGHLLLWLRSRQGRRHQSIWVVYGIAFFTSFSDL